MNISICHSCTDTKHNNSHHSILTTLPYLQTRSATHRSVFSVRPNSVARPVAKSQFTLVFTSSAIRLDTGVLISPQPDQEGSKLQRQKILIFIYPIYNHNWRNISTIYIYKTRLASREVFSPSNKIHWEVGRAKDLSAPRYYDTFYKI